MAFRKNLCLNILQHCYGSREEFNKLQITVTFYCLDSPCSQKHFLFYNAHDSHFSVEVYTCIFGVCFHKLQQRNNMQKCNTLQLHSSLKNWNYYYHALKSLLMRRHALLPVTCCLITVVSRSELSQPCWYISVLGQFYF